MSAPARPVKYRYFLPADHTALGRVGMMARAHRPVPSFPRAVQIQTRTGCNADCVFCPYGETEDLVPKGRMDLALFERIVAECERYQVRRINPHLMNEPFVDSELLDRVGTINRLAPSCRVCITTNGEPLRPATVDRMLDQGGVHRLYVSFQGVDPGAYERTMRGPKFERVLDNVLYLAAEIKRRRLSRPRLTVTMVDTALIDAPAAIAFWQERGITAKSTRLENRGGNIDVDAPQDGSGAHLRKHVMTSFVNCSRLMRQAFVLHDGRVTLCCTDYHQTTIIGDLKTHSLFEVWNSPRALKLRRDFIGGDLSDNPLCRDCTIADRRRS